MGDQGLVQDNGACSDSERLCFGMYGGVQERDGLFVLCCTNTEASLLVCSCRPQQVKSMRSASHGRLHFQVLVQPVDFATVQLQRA